MSEPFTPGPWVVHPLAAQVDCGVESKIGGLLPVAQMLWPTDERSEAETFANAQAMAAVPELVAACRAIIAYDEGDDDRPNAGALMMAEYDHAIALARSAVAKAVTA